jgi:hypothetical protein
MNEKTQTNNALEVLVDADLSMVTGGASLPTDKKRMWWRRPSPDRQRKQKQRR